MDAATLMRSIEAVRAVVPYPSAAWDAWLDCWLDEQYPGSAQDN